MCEASGLWLSVDLSKETSQTAIAAVAQADADDMICCDVRLSLTDSHHLLSS